MSLSQGEKYELRMFLFKSYTEIMFIPLFKVFFKSFSVCNHEALCFCRLSGLNCLRKTPSHLITLKQNIIFYIAVLYESAFSSLSLQVISAKVSKSNLKWKLHQFLCFSLLLNLSVDEIYEQIWGSIFRTRMLESVNVVVITELRFHLVLFSHIV